MRNPYDLHSWSTQYREQALREAQLRHLVGRASRDSRGSRCIRLRWGNPLALLRGIASSE